MARRMEFLADDHFIPGAEQALSQWTGKQPTICAHANGPLMSGPRDWLRVGFDISQAIACAKISARACAKVNRLPLQKLPRSLFLKIDLQVKNTQRRRLESLGAPCSMRDNTPSLFQR